MTKLLIPDTPLQVLPALAKAIGLNEAIFLQQLHYWLQRSKHEHDGRRWIYNTYEQWQKQFPFWSLRTMQRIAASLVEKQLLIVHQFNAQDWDRKNWYTIKYSALEKLSVWLDNPINSDTAKMAACKASEWQDLNDDDKMAASTNTEITQKTSIKIREVFDYWQKVMEHPKAVLDPKRRKAITAQLKDYSVEELKQSIDGYRSSPYHMGQNANQTVYDDIALILRDAAHVERFLKTTNKNGHHVTTAAELERMLSD